jgi:hypothetical protein
MTCDPAPILSIAYRAAIKERISESASGNIKPRHFIWEAKRLSTEKQCMVLPLLSEYLPIRDLQVSVNNCKYKS